MQRVAIIGLGGIGRHHLGCYRKLSDIQVVAVADIRADEIRKDDSLKEMFEVPWEQVHWYNTYEDLLAHEAVDFVDLGLPTYVHKPAAVTFLNAGIPVLCEKPMALTLAECDAMIAASQAHKTPLMIAQCIRFWPEYQYLKELQTSGAVGRLLSLQLWRGGPTPGWSSSHWMMDPTLSGGAILDLHIHDIDYCQYLLGLPRRIYAQGGCACGPERGVDYILTNLDYGDGTQVSASSHWADVDMPFIARYEARFERAFIRMDPTHNPSLSVYYAGKAEEHPSMQGLDAYSGEIAYFSDCVRTRQALERCLPLDARNSVAMIMAAKASIEGDKPVELSHYAL